MAWPAALFDARTALAKQQSYEVPAAVIVMMKCQQHPPYLLPVLLLRSAESVVGSSSQNCHTVVRLMLDFTSTAASAMLKLDWIKASTDF